ncbi:excalibur calcium-binding domain-containing protein [Spirillospora sp. NPDC029432]|uniref:excalibur calcium-binding domain-containing protein n=1 Tax=Spirillospora sp. NPDC029432 TaxID=3154599 RepID=UPI0034529ACB
MSHRRNPCSLRLAAAAVLVAGGAACAETPERPPPQDAGERTVTETATAGPTETVTERPSTESPAPPRAPAEEPETPAPPPIDESLPAPSSPEDLPTEEFLSDEPSPLEPSPDETTDPRFDTCAEANDEGYGPYYEGLDPEYEWYWDRDDDGIVCEPR